MIKKTALPFTSLLIVGVILSGCGSSSDDPAKINDSDKKHEQKQNKDSSKQQKNKKNNKDNKDDKNQKKDNKKEKETTTLNEAIEQADQLHDFIVYDSSFTNDLKSNFKDNGIKLEGDYYSPYTDVAKAPEQAQSYIFAGIIDDKKVDKKKDSAIITYKVKSGMSSTDSSTGEEADYEVVGKAIQDKLKNDKKYKNKTATVKYEVKMNKDKTATIKKLTKNDWSRT